MCVGEVMLDGQQSFCYLYSEDLTNSDTVFGAVRYSLTDFKNGDFNALIPSIVGETEDKGIASCSNSAYESMMNSEWKSAVDAGQACLSDVTVLSSSSVNLYETDADFAAKCQSDDIKGCAIVDNAGNDFTVGGVIGKLTATNTDEVTYTVVDGVLIKHIDRHITYTCEMVTVIYTKVELKTSLGTEITYNDASSRNVGQRYNTLGQPVGKNYRGIAVEKGRKTLVK